MDALFIKLLPYGLLLFFTIPVKLQLSPGLQARIVGIRMLDTHVFMSAFYPIADGPIRHPLALYQEGFRRLVRHFHHSLLIYTNLFGARLLSENFTVPDNIRFLFKYPNPLSIDRINRSYQKYEEISYIHRNAPYVHSALIGAIWNAKLFLLGETAESNPEALYVHWIDIGLLKSGVSDWNGYLLPNLWKLEACFKAAGNSRILFNGLFSHSFSPPPVKLDQVDIEAFENAVLGGYFGGPRKQILSLVDEYFAIHDVLMRRNQMVLREELILATYCLMHTDHCMFVEGHRSSCVQWESVAGFLSVGNPCGFGDYVIIWKWVNDKLLMEKLNFAYSGLKLDPKFLFSPDYIS